MGRLRVANYVLCFILLFMVGGGLISYRIASAASGEIIASSPTRPEQASPPAEEIKATCRYPTLSSYLGVFTYDIDLQYTGGKQPRVFDLKVKVPSGFKYSIEPSYEAGKEIAAIRLDPEKAYPETVKVTVRPLYAYLVPKPGEYTITVEAVEAKESKIKASIELKAIALGNYDLNLKTETGRLNIEATSGKDTVFTVVVSNTGTVELEKVNLLAPARDRPSGWSVKFDPEKIDSLAVGAERAVEVKIRPEAKTIAGDYELTMEAEPEARNAYSNLRIRVTVLTPTIWGWLGVGIVILVIAGLAVMFVRLGRR